VNGVVESMNHTLLKRAISMSLQLGLPASLRGKAVNHACYLVNQLPSTIIDLKISKKVWTTGPVSYDSLRVSGCPAYSLADRNKSKLRSATSLCSKNELKVTSYGIWKAGKRVSTEM